MEVIKLVVGVLEENCYILKKNGTCLVVDPGDEYQKIKEKIGEDKILGVLITHSHFDHIGALRSFLTKRSIKIFKKSICPEKSFELGDFKWDVIHTPGHSNDSISFYFKDTNDLFVGDVLFKETVGRWDLPTGSKEDLLESLRKIKNLPKETKIYPGHNEITTIKEELENNEIFINA